MPVQAINPYTANSAATTSMVQLRYQSVCIYEEYLFSRNFSELDKKLMAERLAVGRELRKHNNEIGTYTGNITKGSAKRIRMAVNLLLQKSPERKIFNEVTNKVQKFSVNFITLTISQEENISAGDAYKYGLAKFLQWLTKTMKVNDYVWKVELQERGQPHYHITTNKFIHFQRIKDKWNYIQAKAGWLDDYRKKFNTLWPNSTDIHAVYKVKDIEAYLVKYISKASDSGHIKGKVWDCSKSLKGRKYFKIEMNDAYREKIEELECWEGSRKFVSDNAVFLRCQRGYHNTFLTDADYQDYLEHIKPISRVDSKAEQSNIELNICT